MKLKIDKYSYELVKNERDCFNIDEFKEVVTDYFYEFDYILGDYAYDKLRLKGYYESNSIKVNQVNNINSLDDYVKNYCAYKAKYFLLKKIK